MGGYDGSIRIDSSIDSKGFNTGIRGMLGAVAKLGAALGIALGVAALVNFGKEAVSTASQTESAWIGLQSIVEGSGKSFGAAKKFLNEYVSDGLVPLSNAITAYKNLAARGYSTEQIEQTLNALKDAAAFGKASSFTMGEAIQGATEGLKNENSILVDNAGVTKNVSIMWKEYAESIGTTVGNLTKQQKIQAEVDGIMNESRFQVGDAAKLAGTYAGKVAALGTSFYNLKVAVGSAIMPILSAVMPYIKAAVDQLVVFFNMVAGIVAALFGVQLGGAAQAMEDVAAGTNEAADAQGNLAQQTGEAGKAAKGALASFDELNVLQTEDASGGGGGGGGGVGAAGGMGITPLEATETGSALDAMGEKVQALKDKLVAFFGPLQAPFERLKEAAMTLGGTIWDGLVWVWENILKPVGEWIIQEAAPVFIDLLAEALETMNDVLLALKPLGIWLYDNFLVPVGNWVGQAILDALKWLKERLSELGDWVTANQETFSTFVGVLGAIGLAIFLIASPVGQVILVIAAVVAVIALLVEWVKYVVDAFQRTQEIATWVWAQIKGVWGAAWSWFKNSVVEPIKEIFGPMFELLGILANNAWVLIKLVWGIASAWFKEKVIDPVSTWFDTVWADISEWANGAWEKIKGIWQAVATWFTTNVTDPIKDAFGNALDWVKEKWETIWTGITDFLKGIINSVIDKINSLLSGIAIGINGIITTANKVGVVLPGWEVIPLVTAPQIPRLASGAVIPPNAEFLALLGDQRAGRNIEAPEALLRQIVQEEVGRVQADIRIEFGGTLGALVRELKPHIDRETVRIGRSMVAGGAG